ncbi:HAMP domain-containing sensor histidine kinase [Sphaerisporangium sp. TRM90804]|uniref:sensor histidine kinase n=1 Tax=Sphaerisporangium sp. TRM90804 TaxID=3031113 RepID=UPI00244D27B8|nr:HAMP domain-containing sensor histidine kinase [Sphaerisporangium sp. TRM90804]MDH2424296.1 HAMP domain-containing sensor histidine kinase [Sphaerisporangium sp. TRM90804]
MSEQRDRDSALDAGRPSFAAPQPTIVPPDAPGEGAERPADSGEPAGAPAASASAAAPAKGSPGPSTTAIFPASPSAGTARPSGAATASAGGWGAPGGPWAGEPTVETTRRPFRSKNSPPPPSGPPAWDGPPPVGPNPVAPDLLARLRHISKRMSIRMRLTLTYGGLFFAAGALLLFVIYSFVGRAIYDSWPSLPFSLDQLEPEHANYLQTNWEYIRGDTIAAARARVLTRSLMALAGVGILALIAGYFVADRALRPVQKMTATARRLSETSLAHERIDLHGPHDELKELADTFDAMLTRLNRAFDAQRRFVDNASHELRTPLAINRTVLEVALGDPHASDDLRVLGRTLLGTNARNEHLIEGLLLLARSERELAVRKPVDLRDVGHTVVEQHSSFAEECDVTVRTDLRTAPTMGDPVLLERLVANLVENAIKHNLSSAGQVWLRTGMVDGAPVVQVANTGPHVPAYEVDDLFEPFRRLHSDRVESARGAGLGLSIVRAVVRAHRGGVKAVPRDGGGLVMTVRLPPG